MIPDLDQLDSLLDGTYDLSVVRAVLNGPTLFPDIDTILPDDQFIANERAYIDSLTDADLEQYRQLYFADKKWAMFYYALAPTSSRTSLGAIGALYAITERFTFGNTDRIDPHTLTYTDRVHSTHKAYQWAGAVLAGVNSYGLGEIAKTFEAYADIKFILESKAEGIPGTDIRLGLNIIRAMRNGGPRNMNGAASGFPQPTDEQRGLGDDAGQCDCPICRAARGETANDIAAEE